MALEVDLMRGRWILLAGTLLACEPPPLAEEPTIRLLYPPPDVGEIPLVETPEGPVLETLVVVSIEGFLFVPFDPEDPILEDVPGEGHWHLYVNNAFEGPQMREFSEYRSQPGDFAPGQAVQLQVILASHTHREIDDAQAQVEFHVGDPVTE